MTGNDANAKKLYSFGMEPEESSHHFVVTLGDKREKYVHISEHFEFFENKERRAIEYKVLVNDPRMRVILDRFRWDNIEDALRFEFNQRLKRSGAKASRFKKGANILPRLFGKEMILLCWAIEDADPALIPVAIRNWQGLKPEERWWLFTQTNAASGQALRGKNLGWRKALRYALTENPVSEDLMPQREVLGQKQSVLPLQGDHEEGATDKY